MTQGKVALKALDLIFIGSTTLILLGIAGVPMEWLLVFADASLREFQWLGVVIILASLWLIHAIATSEPAP
jgi:hypothetical protein